MKENLNSGLVSDPGRLAELRRAIADGSLSPVALFERYQDRIARVDGDVQAWRFVDLDRARRLAVQHEAEAKAGRIRGPLHGIPFAVKDNIDVEGLTTLCNSKSRAGVAAATSDANVVASIRARGGIPLGKVHTTEFTYFDPSPARNPHNLAHTPGGSSSGSAAAVAAGMVPAAIGTQTIASVNRPAAYCGIGAFKPSTGSIPNFGVAPLSPLLDTVGYFGFRTEDAVDLFEAVCPAFLPVARSGPGGVRPILILEDPHLDDICADMTTMLDKLAEALRSAGFELKRVASPVSFTQLFAFLQRIMHYEVARALQYLEAEPAGTVGPRILEAVAIGKGISLDEYLSARQEAEIGRQAVLGLIGEHAVLWPAAPAAAPEGLASTGNPRYIAPWTLIGGPIASIPAGADKDGMPLGCFLTSGPGSDLELCKLARAVAPVARAAFDPRN